MARIKVIVYMAWWFKFYAWGLIATAVITGCEPDMVKVGKVALHALRYRFSDS